MGTEKLRSKASAQQAATLTKWEYVLVAMADEGKAEQARASRLGAEGWELTGTMAYGGGVWCWYKRPKM